MKPSRRALRHDVRDGIVRSILSARYGPGDRLIEMTIAREYGTSQGPVREALRELEMLGFVTSIPNRGTYVRDPWQRGMAELFGLRAALEEYATRMAVTSLSEDVSGLQAEVDAMTAAAEAGDVARAVEHSEAFHRIIVEASGNQLLHNVWSNLGISDHTELTMVTLELDLRAMAASHQPIVDAIRAGDAEEAARVSREHQAWLEDLFAVRAEIPGPGRDPAQRSDAQGSSSKTSTIS
jgi:DNA-binding GntR family transcriptional regulator